METTMTATEWTVFGPLCAHGRTFKSKQAARNARDRMDTKYGSASHTIVATY